MRLSIQIEGAKGLTWPVWKELVREVEELGFAGLYCCDHFAEPAPPDYDSLEVMMAMAYAASHTDARGTRPARRARLVARSGDARPAGDGDR